MKIFTICFALVSYIVFVIGEEKDNDKILITGMLLLCVAAILNYIFIVFPEVTT